jgi:hypothetical protein
MCEYCAACWPTAMPRRSLPDGRRAGRTGYVVRKWCLVRCWLPGSATSRQLMLPYDLCGGLRAERDAAADAGSATMPVASRDRYPTLQRLAPLMQLPGPADRFEAGLALILDGIEARDCQSCAMNLGECCGPPLLNSKCKHLILVNAPHVIDMPLADKPAPCSGLAFLARSLAPRCAVLPC